MTDSIPQQSGPGAGAGQPSRRIQHYRDALEAIIRQPAETMSNGKAIDAMLRIAKAALKAKDHLAAPLAVEDSRERCASSDAKDAARLDYLQRTGSTIDLPSAGQGSFRFRIGGLHAAVHHDLRAAIDAAMAAASSGKEKVE